MNNICCLLDACTAINLIHIDEEDFLLKKMDKLEVHINDTVFDEIKANVRKRIDKAIEYRNGVEKTIDQKLTFFRGKKNDNSELLKDVGGDYFERIKTVTNYTKKLNGELYSSAYALYLSRFSEKKVFFYTDDYPAKEYLSSFFHYQQIGHIKDSVDLLVLLYWLDDKFTEKQLDNLLSDLYSQYATEVTVLKQKLQAFYNNNIDAGFRRTKKDIVENLNILINKLDKLDFRDIGTIYYFFDANKSKCRGTFEIVRNYSSVFELEKKSNNETLLGKILQTRKAIKENKIYKWNDLLSN
jgi:hypothetical protein